MKKKKLIIAGLALLAAGLAGAAFAGCTAPYQFEKYTFNYGGTSENDWRALEYPDTSITMDGLVQSEEYGENHLSFSDVNGVNMKVYAHLGEEGVFFGFISDDKQVNYNTKNDVFNNTSVEIQVAPEGTETLNSNVVQLRLGANGTPDQWIGFPSDDQKYAYTKKYIPSMGVVHIDGELNKSANGYSVELYLPYTSIGLSDRPESVVCAPSFNTLPDPNGSTRATWTMMLGCDLGQPATWYVVDDEGMTAHTAGFKEKGTGIAQEKGFNEFYYFGTAPQESYYLKTTLNVQTTINPFLNDDMFPKFGLVNKSEHKLQTFHIDATNRNGTNFGTVSAIQSTASGTDWMWDNNASTSIEGHWGNDYIGNYRKKQLETIYYGGDLYFVLDGVLVKTVKDFAPESEGAVPGLMCFNTKATFTENEFVTDKALVKAEAEKYMAKDMRIDGDLSDWTDEAVNRHARSVSDPDNGNGMKVRAFRGSDGLYIAYEVAHRVNLTPSKWDEGWWNNTNIEFYVNGAEEKNHYALTTFGSGGYMDAVMTSIRNEDRTYSTTAEIFVPFASLVKDGFDESETLKVGFAFKSANGTADDKLLGKDWWTLEGIPTASQLNVQEKGIGNEFTLTYSAGTEAGVTGAAPASEKVFAGDTVALAQNTLVRDGYEFAGWTDGKHGYLEGDSYLMPEADVTLVPKWIAAGSGEESFGVVYSDGADDVQGDVPVDENKYAPGDIVTIAESVLIRDGYRFMGWTDGAHVYAAGSTVFMGNEQLMLTAVWAKEYILSYSVGADDVTGEVPASAAYLEGETVQIKSVSLTRNGYDFFGWSDGKEIRQAGDSFAMPGENVTLTAVWKGSIRVDGDLSDWEALESKTVGAHSIVDGDERQATWYGVLRENGLYLAVEIYHNSLASGKAEWWKNLNFEIHLGADSVQQYVYISGISGGNYNVGKSAAEMTAAYTHEEGTLHHTAHRSVFEVLLPNSMISGLKETDGSIRIGVAVKTNGDYGDAGSELITGGSYNYESGDAWYAPYGVLADRYDQFAFVTKDGMYLKNEYLYDDMRFGASSAADNTGITLDGDLSDWSVAAGKTIGVTGTDQYSGKSVKFYGKMTKDGLYLAVDAYHSLFAYGQPTWWQNTNFEFRIGEVFASAFGQDNLRAKQYYVYAVSATQFASSMSAIQVRSHVEQLASGSYHTCLELFIPAEDLVEYDYMVQDGMIHVGVAWKTPGDQINNNEMLGGKDTDEWWRPKGTHVEYEPACVNGDGIYTAEEYTALL